MLDLYFDGGGERWMRDSSPYPQENNMHEETDAETLKLAANPQELTSYVRIFNFSLKLNFHSCRLKPSSNSS